MLLTGRRKCDTIRYREKEKQVINQLIEKAQKIEAATDANLSGALNQVIKDLDFDTLEEIFVEKNSKRLIRQVSKVRSGQSEMLTINDLRNSAYSILLAKTR